MSSLYEDIKKRIIEMEEESLNNITPTPEKQMINRIIDLYEGSMNNDNQ